MTAPGDRAMRVGPVLEPGETATAVIAAIRAGDPSAIVEDRGSYLRVLARGPCRITRDAVETALGRPFQLPGDLETIMPSFKGELSITADAVTWSTRR